MLFLVWFQTAFYKKRKWSKCSKICAIFNLALKIILISVVWHIRALLWNISHWPSVVVWSTLCSICPCDSSNPSAKWASWFLTVMKSVFCVSSFPFTSFSVVAPGMPLLYISGISLQILLYGTLQCNRMLMPAGGPLLTFCWHTRNIYARRLSLLLSHYGSF